MSVFIVDDHALFREGTIELLARSPGVRVIGEAGTAEQALALIGQFHPQVAIVDVTLPEMSGIELARILAERFPKLRVLIVSAYDDYAYVTEALDAGVSGYLLKTASGRELRDAVQAVADGVFVLDRTISQRLGRRWRSAPATPPGGALTPREGEVLALLAKGSSNKQVAQKLGLGLRTVESHVSNLLGKLGVTSRTEAVLYAIENQLVTTQDRKQDSADPT